MKKIRVSKPGYNVKTETDINNIVFDSEYDTLKYYTSGTLSIHVVQPAFEFEYRQSTSVNHNLGYYPFHVVYAKDDEVFTSYTPLGVEALGSGASRSFYAYVTTSALVVKVFGTAGAAGHDYTVTFKYKIYRNDIAL